jgi:hypothetical protein
VATTERQALEKKLQVSVKPIATVVPSDAKDKPFSLTSMQPVTVEVNGVIQQIPFSEWAVTLGTNGRGGT